ncbi:helix-turn-helix domain-containing protein [Colwellia sp. 20A7]|jgi:transcriptional regulator with XRE-family HTH domain|uniref:helix-turn-helix domain-containing protein n=1 Tax=Colwellia sp. 20A7 TaxID=2689569 RepID=UPI00135917CE|nr:helix-turn-helix transcriptional regulator [Colwellia sp. 20A7]
MNIIGFNIRKIRERKEWTQDLLAAKCNLLQWNISRGTLAKIEAKVRRVTDIEVKILAQVLNVTIEELFEDT